MGPLSPYKRLSWPFIYELPVGLSSSKRHARPTKTIIPSLVKNTNRLSSLIQIRALALLCVLTVPFHFVSIPCLVFLHPFATVVLLAGILCLPYEYMVSFTPSSQWPSHFLVVSPHPDSILSLDFYLCTCHHSLLWMRKRLGRDLFTLPRGDVDTRQMRCAWLEDVAPSTTKLI